MEKLAGADGNLAGQQHKCVSKMITSSTCVFVPQRRAKLVLLEKIDRGEVKGDSVRKYTAEEASELLDDQLAHSQKHTAMAYRGGRAL